MKPPHRLPGLVASGELPSAVESRVQTGRLHAPTLMQPPTRARTLPEAPEGGRRSRENLGPGSGGPVRGLADPYNCAPGA